MTQVGGVAVPMIQRDCLKRMKEEARIVIPLRGSLVIPVGLKTSADELGRLQMKPHLTEKVAIGSAFRHPGTMELLEALVTPLEAYQQYKLYTMITKLRVMKLSPGSTFMSNTLCYRGSSPHGLWVGCPQLPVPSGRHRLD